MAIELTAIIERVEGQFVARCAEIPEATGQGRTKVASLVELRRGAEQILSDRREEAVLSSSEDAAIETIRIDID